ncbi:MAG TPA: hypothetical protein VNN73_07105 [Blastocatellia bacterium]|nr:hypothetical protein [Blastocatellia bacterium]
MIELACPETCSYLRDARDSAAERERIMREREAATEGRVIPQITERLLPILLMTESTIINTKRGLKGSAIEDLDDREALEAVENVIKNLQTEESGLIYEHTAANPRAEELSRRIRAALDELVARYGEQSPPRRGEIIQALEHIRGAIQSHIKRGEDRRSFLRYIALFFPWPEEAAKPQIIV